MTSAALVPYQSASIPVHIPAEVLSSDFPEPKAIAVQSARIALLWKGAAVIAAVVLGIISIIAVYAFLTLYSQYFLLVPLLLAGPLLLIGEVCSKCLEKSAAFKDENMRQNKILEILKSIENHSHSQMVMLLMQNGIDFSRILISDFSSRPFKILVSRYLYHTEFCREVLQKLENPNFPIRIHPKSTDEELVRYYQTRSAVKEFVVFAEKVQMAVILQRMYRPSEKVLLESIGRITPKYLLPRHISQIHLGVASPYFVFNNENNHPISPSEMEYHTISTLQQRLFSN